jgi:hypothetical protein
VRTILVFHWLRKITNLCSSLFLLSHLYLFMFLSFFFSLICYQIQTIATCISCNVFLIVENQLSQLDNNSSTQTEKESEYTNEDMNDDQEEIEEITTTTIANKNRSQSGLPPLLLLAEKFCFLKVFLLFFCPFCFFNYFLLFQIFYYFELF